MVHYRHKDSNFRFASAALRPTQPSINRKRRHGKPGTKCDDNIKMDLKEVGCKDVNLKGLVQVCVRGLDVNDIEYLGSTTSVV